MQTPTRRLPLALGVGRAFSIRIVAVVLHLNAPQPFRLGEPR